MLSLTEESYLTRDLSDLERSSISALECVTHHHSLKISTDFLPVNKDVSQKEIRINTFIDKIQTPLTKFLETELMTKRDITFY